MFKRRRNKKTDYKQRMALLKSGLPRLVARRALGCIHLQVISYDESGDAVIIEDSSKTLKKYGWLGHCGNTPAAYLAGLLVGTKAKKAGIASAVLDIGLQTSVKGSALYAAALGAADAGLHIPVGKNIIPDMKRISGQHISSYAALLKKEDMNKYKKQFASYLKSGLEPEKIAEHFEHIKSKIISEAGIEGDK
jgi:large subunit ribosomal protein L18